MVSLLDPEGRPIDLSEWCALTGQTVQEARRSGWLDALHPDDRSRAAAAWDTAREHHGRYNIDFRVRRADGQLRWFNSRNTAIRNPDGTVSHWFGVLLPIAGPHRMSIQVAPGGPFTGTARGQLSSSIIRAARAMLNWSATELCARSGVSVSTIRRLEQEERGGQSRRTSTDRLMQAFGEAGVRFVDGNGNNVITGVGWSGER